MQQDSTDRLMRIAVSGTNGKVGRALSDALLKQGRVVRPIVRRGAGADEIAWDTASNTFDVDALTNCDAVVHLAGENVMGRWSDSKRKRIYDSRVPSTRGLATALASLEHGPRTLIVASAIGYYGDTGQSDARTEDDPPGDTDAQFLAKVCYDWEQAAQPARDAGLRVVHVRIGLVLSAGGGVLKQMLPAFKLGLGGPVGSGKQWMSWIALSDLVRIIMHCIDSPSITGPINAVAPGAVTNKTFASTLGKVLKRPAVLPAPGFIVKLLFGTQCAQATALGSMRVSPRRLTEVGFAFEYPDLESALRHELGR